jgi:hypothetical protein
MEYSVSEVGLLDNFFEADCDLFSVSAVSYPPQERQFDQQLPPSSPTP